MAITKRVGISILAGNSINIKNWPPTNAARIIPIINPKNRAEKITLYCSYINILTPWFFVRPIALKHPNSWMLSLMLWLVDIKSKKNEIIIDMIPIKRTNISKSKRELFNCFKASLISKITVMSSLKKDLTPFYKKSLLSCDASSDILM